MSDDALRYSPEIDALVPKAVEASLHTKVLSAKKLLHGEVNHVYKVETTDETVVMRIFRRKYWPGVVRVKHIEKLLEPVPSIHPKTLFITDDVTYFPNGFMITQFIEGKNGQEAIEDGDVSFEDFHRTLFRNLKKIYTIPVSGFGYLNSEEEVCDDYLSFRIDKLNDRFSDLKDIEEFDEVYRVQIEDIFKGLVSPVNKKVKAVLVHGDPTPANSIYTTEQNIVLLDWDNASSNFFLQDISWLTYWGSHVTGEGEKSKRNKILWQILLEEFGDVGFSEQELKVLERINHIGISLDLLPYYHLDQQNQEAYELVKKRLAELVEDI